MNFIQKIFGNICKFWFYKKKWKIANTLPPEIKKGVIVCGPHTSIWDGIFASAAVFEQKININFAIKKELMFFPLGYFFKKIGGISIDRNKKVGDKKISSVEQISKIFDEDKNIFLAISPEGTRKYNPNLKTGFYYIAKNANVPIILAYLDYEKKEAGWGPIFEPSLEIDIVIKNVKSFYKNIHGKKKERGIY